MPRITLTLPVVGQPDSTEEPKIPTDFNTVTNAINGNLGIANMLPAFLQTMGTVVANPVGGGALPSGMQWGYDFGSTSANFASSNHATVTVTHHLSAAPPMIFTGLYGSGAQTYGCSIYSVTSGASQIIFNLTLSASASSWTILFYWFAVSYVATPTSGSAY